MPPKTLPRFSDPWPRAASSALRTPNAIPMSAYQRIEVHKHAMGLGPYTRVSGWMRPESGKDNSRKCIRVASGLHAGLPEGGGVASALYLQSKRCR